MDNQSFPHKANQIDSFAFVNMKLASFDIFDTALIRRCGKPENIFYLLSHRLYPDDVAKQEDFLLWRIKAERAAIDRYRHEVMLTDIYDDPDLDGFNEYSKDELVAIEKEVEADNLIANVMVKALISQKRDAGYTICFISDMYLDNDFLSTILIREGCLLVGEQIFVSCEQGMRKSTGALYGFVKKQLYPDLWEHYGDNRQSDVKIARKVGIKATCINSGFTNAERRLLKEKTQQRDKYSLSLLTGLSRAARLSDSPSAEVTLAADFVVSTYIPYALFILRTARERGIRRLYFLSRDSYILMKTVQVLSPNDIELRYLFVSRQSLLLPYLAEPTAERFLEVMDHKTVYRKHVDILLHKLGTERNELQEISITFDYNHIATRDQEQDFLHKIFDEAFVPVLQQRAQKERQNLLAYFEQEGLFDGTENAMVDIGWLGTSRLMINRMLRETGHCETLFLYFGIRNDVLPTNYGRYITYFPAGQLSTESTVLLENYFSASPYPTTIGYRHDEGCIVPIFPIGTFYTETSIIRANVGVMESLMPIIASMKFIREEILYQWAALSIDSIISLKSEMDLSPVAQCSGFGKEPLARRLTFVELCSAVLLGNDITALDRMSIYMTCGKQLRSSLLKCHKTIHHIKNLIFRKYIYKPE